MFARTKQRLGTHREGQKNGCGSTKQRPVKQEEEGMTGVGVDPLIILFLYFKLTKHKQII